MSSSRSSRYLHFTVLKVNSSGYPHNFLRSPLRIAISFSWILSLDFIPGFHSWISFLDFILGFHPSFSRHGRIKASFILLIWLNENVSFLDQYVVINKLAISHPFPHREVSPFQFPCSSHFVPSSSAQFWDLVRIHW